MWWKKKNSTLENSDKKNTDRLHYWSDMITTGANQIKEVYVKAIWDYYEAHNGIFKPEDWELVMEDKYNENTQTQIFAWYIRRRDRRGSLKEEEIANEREKYVEGFKNVIQKELERNGGIFLPEKFELVEEVNHTAQIPSADGKPNIQYKWHIRRKK